MLSQMLIKMSLYYICFQHESNRLDSQYVVRNFLGDVIRWLGESGGRHFVRLPLVD